MESYEQELANFRQQWNLPSYDLDRLAESVQALRFADSFLMGSSSDNSPTAQYKKWFSRTLSLYFEANTTPNKDGKYMSSFDTQAFYDSFKNLVQAKYDSDAKERGEVPLQVEDVTNGQKQSLENIIANCKRNYKKTLPALWYENLKNGTMDMQNLQNITSSSFDVVNKKWYVDANEMAGELTNIVAAREAMQQLRASRSGVWGWLWKVIFNRAQNRQEKEYLQQLNNQISTLTEKGYQMDGITRKLTEKTVFGKDVNAKTETTRTQDKKAAKTKADPVENLVKPKAIQPVASQISEKATSEFINNLAAKLHEELPGNNMAKFVRVVQYQAMLTRSFETINQLNENFDAAVANGGDPKKEMAKVVHGVFKTTDKFFKETEKEFLGRVIETSLDNMEGLKIAVQFIIDNLTAAAIYPNELSDAVSEYMEQNLAIYEEIATDGKEYADEIGNYQKMLEGDAVVGDDYEPAFGDDNPFVENDDKIVPQVPQEPKQNVPTLNNGNK